MARVRHGGTTPELAVCQLLKLFRISFKTSGKGLPGTPDILNMDEKWAIFVHGCFWHRHRGCLRTTTPKKNRAFWLKKFQQNRARDKRKVAELRRLGYRVAIVWECELDEPGRVARKVFKLLEQPPFDAAVRSRHARRETYRMTSSGTRVVRSVRMDNGRVAVGWVRIPSETDGDPESLFDQIILKKKTAPTSVSQGKPVRIVDLFSGCGGLSLGAREACRALARPFEAVLALDLSPASLNVYKRNFDPLLAYARDIREVLNGETGSAPRAHRLDARWAPLPGPFRPQQSHTTDR